MLGIGFKTSENIEWMASPKWSDVACYSMKSMNLNLGKHNIKVRNWLEVDRSWGEKSPVAGVL